MRIELYTRQGCHLCDEAEQILLGEGLAPTLVDINAQPELLATYNECVPVVVMDGKVRFRGKVDLVLLRRLMKNPT